MSREVTPPKAVKLIHLSDIHFGAVDHNALDAVRDYVDKIRPDALIVAGDITQNGRQREFLAARAWLGGLGVRCIVAPGNHDTPGLHLPHHLHRRLSAPFGFYRRHMAEFDCVGRVVELGEGLVRIAAINTARGLQGRLNWADGVIDLADLDDMLQQLGKGREDAWRILVCHHPLREPGHSRISVDTRRGAHALDRCAAAHVDAVLTGHIHDAFAHPLNATRRHLVQMGSGTLSTRLRGTYASFCLVTVEPDNIQQDIVAVGPNGLVVHRNYDSRTHQPEMLFQHPVSRNPRTGV